MQVTEHRDKLNRVYYKVDGKRTTKKEAIEAEATAAAEKACQFFRGLPGYTGEGVTQGNDPYVRAKWALPIGNDDDFYYFSFENERAAKNAALAAVNYEWYLNVVQLNVYGSDFLEVYSWNKGRRAQ